MVEDQTQSSAPHPVTGEEGAIKIESHRTSASSWAAWCVSGGPPPRCQL